MREPEPITLQGLMDIGFEPRRGYIHLINGVQIGLEQKSDGWEVRIYKDDRKSSFCGPTNSIRLGR